MRQGDRVELLTSMVFGQDMPLVGLPVRWSFDDFPHFGYTRSDAGILPSKVVAGHVLENWFGDFAWMKRMSEWGVLTYTFHPHVIGRRYRMLVLERLTHALREDGATFVTMEQAYSPPGVSFPPAAALDIIER